MFVDTVLVKRKPASKCSHRFRRFCDFENQESFFEQFLPESKLAAILTEIHPFERQSTMKNRQLSS
jgi:hypothetical protein